MKILICINTLTAVNQAAYANHCAFFFRVGKTFAVDQIALLSPQRMTIDACRNYAAKIALEHEFDYILMLDDDVLIPEDALSRLIAADKDVICGNVVIRGYPFNNMFFRFNEDKTLLNYFNDIPESEIEGTLVRVDAVGCSLTLLKVKLLQKMRPPYFVTGSHHTEDIYFCMKAQEQVPDVSIYCDLSLKCHHIMTPQAVSPDNKIYWKEFEENCDPALTSAQAPSEDRTERYLEVNAID